MESSNKLNKKSANSLTKKDNNFKNDLSKNQSEDKESTTEQVNSNDNNNNNNNDDKYFSEMKFTDFDLSPETLEALSTEGYTTATEIQAQCIPLALEGNDIIGSAKTGSGKSLAFLVPAIENFIKADLSSESISETIKVLVLTPTRELALQLYNLTNDLLKYQTKRYKSALIIGGANRRVEAEKLRFGVSIVIATPGRLLDHFVNTKGVIKDNIKTLIIDEADAILKIGFEKEIKDILDIIPKQRQTLLFSATMNTKVEDLVRLSLKNYTQIGIKSKEATVSALEQGYVVVESDKKFLLLYTFIRKNIEKKIMVFFSSCKSVEFYTSLLNYVDVPVKSIHGGHKQQKRSTTYLEFLNSDKGILLCTDVAQRGLDFPDVDWIIQYDPPHGKFIINNIL